MIEFQVSEWSKNVPLDQVAHVLLPGRGRNPAADWITYSSFIRVLYGAEFFSQYKLEEKNGIIVPSGYKTPAENNGKLWTPEDSLDEQFRGIPEADSMLMLLLLLGIKRASVSVERHSIDTTTNFLMAEQEGHFPDDGKPVAIFAQAAHLERMLRYIAPKTLRREYVGVVVPDFDPPERDSVFASGPANMHFAV